MDYARYRTHILQEIDGLRALSDGSREGRAPVELDQQSVGRLSRMDAMQQQSMDLAREDRRRARLAVMAAALRRPAQGDYAYRLGCDEHLPEKQLDIDAAVTLCINCQRYRCKGWSSQQ